MLVFFLHSFRQLASMLAPVFYFVIGTTVLCLQIAAAASAGKEVELQDYIRDYLANSPLLSQTRIREKQQRLEKAIAEQRWTSSLALMPEISQSSLAVNPGSYADETRDTQLQLELQQNLPTGTLLGLKGAYSWRQSKQEENSHPTESYAFFLRQSLWQDWAGRQGELNLQLAEGRLKRSTLEHQANILKECLSASRLYLELFIRQEMHTLFEASARDAEEIFQRYERLFQQRLIQETEFLTAESDLLANRQRLLDEHLRYQESLIAFLSPLKSPVQLQRPKLSSPDLSELQKQLASIEAENLQENANVKRVELEIQESLTRLAQVREKSRARVDLIFEMGRRKSEQIIDFGLLTAQREYAQLGISANLPLNNKIPLFEVERAQSEIALGQEKRREALQTIELEVQRVQTQLDFLAKRMTVSKKRSEVLEAKLKAARIQVDRLQMELFDYIRHRSELISGRLEEFEIQWEQWNQQLEFLQLLNVMPAFCRV